MLWDSIRGTDRIATYFRQLYNNVYVSNGYAIMHIVDFRLYIEREKEKERETETEKGGRERMYGRC